jgi:hypothetical protein
MGRAQPLKLPISFVCLVDVPSGLDECQVTERLREVADLAFAPNVVFLGEDGSRPLAGAALSRGLLPVCRNVARVGRSAQGRTNEPRRGRD